MILRDQPAPEGTEENKEEMKVTLWHQHDLVGLLCQDYAFMAAFPSFALRLRSWKRQQRERLEQF